MSTSLRLRYAGYPSTALGPPDPEEWVGPTGPAGATGATGPQGPAGPAGSGTVTSIATGAGLSGGPITTAGTLTANVTSVFGRSGAVALTSSDVTTALTFTPYNATNPSGYAAGTVTTASVVSANGFAGSVATATTTPAITLTTSITGLLKGNGTAISAAAAGTDYIAPGGALGTPASGVLTNCTGLPVAGGGTGVTTSTGSGANVLATSPTLVTPILGTPTSGTLTNCTGLPVAGGGTGATTSTGSGANVLGTSPTLVTPILGTPTSGNLANCTAYPFASLTGTTAVALTSAANSWSAAQRGTIVTLTDAATVASDFSLGNNFTVTLAGNRTLGLPTNLVAGQAGQIVVKQDAAGSRTLAYNSVWKFRSGSAPTLTTTASAMDILSYFVVDSTHIAVSSGLNFA